MWFPNWQMPAFGLLRFTGVHTNDPIYAIALNPIRFFLHKAATEYRLDLEHSFVIGDHPHDIIFAENAEARGIYVLTGHGKKHRNVLRGDEVVVQGIAEAVAWIMRQCRQQN